LIASDQIRAARALLQRSAQDLADSAGVGIATVRRFETIDSVPTGQVRVLSAIQIALEEAGVEFIGTPDHHPGVRLKNK
jgi:hypothetical protein